MTTTNDEAAKEVLRMWEGELSHRCSYTHEERRTAIHNLLAGQQVGRDQAVREAVEFAVDYMGQWVEGYEAFDTKSDCFAAYLATQQEKEGEF